jgi:hypothetical protein
MTVVLDRRVTVTSDAEDGGAGPRIDDAPDVVWRYLERWVEADGQVSCPDQCSMGLVTAMRAARSNGVIFDPGR